MKNFLLAFAVIVFASAAFAVGEWRQDETSTGELIYQLTPNGGIGGGGVAYFTMVAGAPSRILDVSKCGKWTLLFDPDVVDDTDVGQITVQSCTGGSTFLRGGGVGTNALCPFHYGDSVGATLNGDESVGRNKLVGYGDSLIKIVANTSPGADTAIAAVLCSK